jgi:hypothetical protein
VDAPRDASFTNAHAVIVRRTVTVIPVTVTATHTHTVGDIPP